MINSEMSQFILRLTIHRAHITPAVLPLSHFPLLHLQTLRLDLSLYVCVCVCMLTKMAHHNRYTEKLVILHGDPDTRTFLT